MAKPQSTLAADRSELAPLPPYMVSRPFGTDEAGRPVGSTKGTIIRTSLEYMLECVAQRTAERGDPVDEAQATALAELLSRLNAAIPDPQYHVSAEYLMNEGHVYSLEFDIFFSHICRELSGDPRFHFNRGTRGNPAFLVLLARPFSLSRVYHMLPRFAAKVADTDLRVASVSADRAVIRWHGEKDLARLPQPLHRLFIDSACQYIQGALASIPYLLSKGELPMAAIRELRCQLRGDPCCEWEFTWEPAKGRAMGAAAKPVARTTQGEKPATGGRLPAFETDPTAMSAWPASAPLPDTELSPLPPFVEGAPFGADQEGRPIRQITGMTVVSSLRHMLDCVAWEKSRELSPDVPPDECAARIAEAQSQALDLLIARLNSVVPDVRYRVTGDYLLDEGNYYSHEFNLYVNEFAREISGDPYFHFHRGLKSIPASLLALGRPLSLRQIFSLVPRFATRVSEVDFQVVRTTRNSAVIRWLPARQLAEVPPGLHRRYLNSLCQAYQGVLSAIPNRRADLPVAHIQERRCAVRGDAYCEWEFTWEPTPTRVGPVVWGGVVVSAVLLGYTLGRLPGWHWIAVAMTVLPAVAGWLVWRAGKSAARQEEAERLLLETRDTAEKQFDDFQQANAQLQLSNTTLNQQLAELTALHEIGQTLSVTLDLEELLDRSLRAVMSHLAFDRGLILLLEKRAGSQVLGNGRMVGGTPEMAALLKRVEIHVEGSQSFLAEIIRSGQPRLVRDAAAEVEDADSLRYLEALEARTFLAVPLVAQGKPVGLLVVDNAVTGRPISDTRQNLLLTVGTQIASAVDSTRLRQTLEQRVTERTAELAKAIHQAEEARAMAEEANRGRGALLDEMVQQNQYLAALHDTTVGLISRLDVNELLEALITRAGQLLNAPHGFIYLAEPGDAELECLVGVGAINFWVGSRLKPGEGLGGKVWQTGEPLVVNDYDRWKGRIDQFEPGILGAVMGVPLKSGGQVVGTIGLAYEPGANQTFGKEEIELLSRFAQLASVALDNARLYSAAQETQRRMADIIDFLPDATLVIDCEGKVIAWNRAIEEMTGIPAQEMLGKGDHEYALPFYAERRPILVDLVLQPDEEIETRYAYLVRSGNILMGEAHAPALRSGPAYLYATASALRNSRGEIVGAIETIRDISDRKRAEEELRQAKAVAESATQAKSAFLATMSHEIRTPMNAVIGMTSLLLDTPLTGEQRDFAETIRISGDALLTIINDILDFSKIEAGKLDLDNTPFDLRECVEGALDLLVPNAREKGLNLAYLMEPQVPAAIEGDVTRLRQILVNLIGNAIKFTDQGEVVVTVTRDAETRGHGDTETDSASPRLPITEFPPVRVTASLHFAVRDTGIGIPPDRMDRLFQSFSQVDGSTTRRYGGTGLGLAISRRLAELMGGRMWAESSGVPGQGSIFHFTIQAQPASLPTRAELQAGAPDLRGRQVLIVEDNATNRRIFTLQMEGWGMVPRDTGSPIEALDWLRGGATFDVALIDLQMPVMDGLELTSEIRKLDLQMPLILVSSMGQREAGVDSRDFAAFLLKPIKPSQLYDALVGIFAHASVLARTAAATSKFDAEIGKREPLRILLAEDNAVNQKLAVRLLERLGYRADVAASGLEAIRAVERQPYDVVLMDVQMPEMDGLEATRQICARWAAGERPRIIAMTANALAEDREACLAAGMNDYLAKPIRVEELVAALSRCRQVHRQD